MNAGLCVLTHRKYGVVGRAHPSVLLDGVNHPSSDPTSTTCWLCDLEQITKPVWASDFFCGNLMEIMNTCVLWLQWALSEMKSVWWLE